MSHMQIEWITCFGVSVYFHQTDLMNMLHSIFNEFLHFPGIVFSFFSFILSFFAYYICWLSIYLLTRIIAVENTPQFLLITISLFIHVLFGKTDYKWNDEWNVFVLCYFSSVPAFNSDKIEYVGHKTLISRNVFFFHFPFKLRLKIYLKYQTTRSIDEWMKCLSMFAIAIITWNQQLCDKRNQLCWKKAHTKNMEIFSFYIVSLFLCAPYWLNDYLCILLYLLKNKFYIQFAMHSLSVTIHKYAFFIYHIGLFSYLVIL